MLEVNFDGLVGPTHLHGGLSFGNLASTSHAGRSSNPRAAALQGLEKMRLVARLGLPQAVLPPHPRPDVLALRQLGFSGSDAEVVSQALRVAPELLAAASSASAMWAANAATVAPSCDTYDGRLHIVPANLSSLLHRSLEVRQTTRTLRTIFSDQARFVVHDPLPSCHALGDEGAANHSRLATEQGVTHLFGWGRRGLEPGSGQTSFPARQTEEASHGVLRLLGIRAEMGLLWPQAQAGIDAGAFHSDVLALGNGRVFLLHELAFADPEGLVRELRARLGESLSVVLASEHELPAADAVAAYPFNSQLLSLEDGSMVIVAPTEAETSLRARTFLARVLAEKNPVERVLYVEVNESMRNGGGPACLRLRVPMTSEERAAISARVFLDDALYADLRSLIESTYRDRLCLSDLADPSLLQESRCVLEALARLLRLDGIFEPR
jgi:succinylarginine dihydrolase